MLASALTIALRVADSCADYYCADYVVVVL